MSRIGKSIEAGIRLVVAWLGAAGGGDENRVWSDYVILLLSVSHRIEVPGLEQTYQR